LDGFCEILRCWCLIDWFFLFYDFFLLFHYLLLLFHDRLLLFHNQFLFLPRFLLSLPQLISQLTHLPHHPPILLLQLSHPLLKFFPLPSQFCLKSHFSLLFFLLFELPHQFLYLIVQFIFLGLEFSICLDQGIYLTLQFALHLILLLQIIVFSLQASCFCLAVCCVFPGFLLRGQRKREFRFCLSYLFL